MNSGAGEQRQQPGPFSRKEEPLGPPERGRGVMSPEVSGCERLLEEHFSVLGAPAEL